MPNDDAALLDIAKAAHLVQVFVAGMTRETFLTDVKTQSAVLHQLLIVGEATKRLSPELRANQSQIPWRLMAGMRDVLIHAYDSVDLEEVWRTATEDVPELLSQLELLLPEKGNSSSGDVDGDTGTAHA